MSYILRYKEGRFWIRSMGNPFRSIKAAREHAFMIGASRAYKITKKKARKSTP